MASIQEVLTGPMMQQGAVTWLSTNLRTQVWWLDMFLVMMVTAFLSSMFAWIANKGLPSLQPSHLWGLFVGWWRKYNRHELRIEYNTVTNKWGDECPFECKHNNKFLLSAVFTYLESIDKLKAAKVDIEDSQNNKHKRNRYQQMKHKIVQLKPLQGTIIVDDDISIEVEINVDDGGESKNRTSKQSMTIISKQSFENCRKFADKSYEYWVASEYKELDTDEESKKLKYYSIRGIDHDSGEITWNQFPLGTGRTFEYLFFPAKEPILKLIDNFTNKRAQFAVGATSWKLGFLLYGKPGCGKTSFIKALANYTNRHVFDLQLNKFAKNSELRDAFFCETITHRTGYGTNTDWQKVPLENRIIIMEDIDALSDIVKKRSKNTDFVKDYKELSASGTLKKKATSVFGKEEKKEKEEKEEEDDDDKQKEKVDPVTAWLKKQDGLADALNLGTLLSILDGTLELTGPIVIMTTNHPEQLDPALIRSGRITRQVYFGNMDVAGVKAMLEYYFPEAKDEAELTKYLPTIEFLDDKIAPNDLESICKNSNTLCEACAQLTQTIGGDIRISGGWFTADDLSTVKNPTLNLSKSQGL